MPFGSSPLISFTTILYLKGNVLLLHAIIQQVLNYHCPVLSSPEAITSERSLWFIHSFIMLPLVPPPQRTGSELDPFMALPTQPFWSSWNRLRSVCLARVVHSGRCKSCKFEPWCRPNNQVPEHLKRLPSIRFQSNPGAVCLYCNVKTNHNYHRILWKLLSKFPMVCTAKPPINSSPHCKLFRKHVIG